MSDDGHSSPSATEPPVSAESDEFVEDAEPSNGSSVFALNETLLPRPGKGGTFGTFDLPEHHAKTQRRLAFTTLGLAGILFIGAGACLALDIVTNDQFMRLTAAFSPFTALAAGAIGFYFGTRD